MSNFPTKTANNEDDLNPFADPAVVEALNQSAVETTTAPPITTNKQTSSLPKAPSAFDLQNTQSYNINSQNSGYPAPTSMTTYDEQMNQLRMREQELNQKERYLNQIQNQPYVLPPNNFPPLPSWCPIKPCFRIAAAQDIPAEKRGLVRGFEIGWYSYTTLLLINIIGAILYCTSGAKGFIVTMVLSVVLGVLFIMLSFYFMYYAAYQGIARNSSFNYIKCMVSTAVAILVNIVQSLGIGSSGWCGFINATSAFEEKSALAGAVCVLIGLCFVAMACLNIYLLKRIHAAYKARNQETNNTINSIVQAEVAKAALRSVAPNLS